MTRRSRYVFAVLLSFVLLAAVSFGQNPREKKKDEKDDNPAGFDKWFMKSRVPRNVKASPASLLEKGTEQKMKLRADHLQRLQAARLAGKRLAGVGSASSVWTSLGPSPIIENYSGVSATQSWTGRITAVAVDQTDSTGNTVVVGGAYGGVWRTTNATAATASIKWSSLTDDQATLSMGSIAIQPGNGATILAGTGEGNNSGDSYYGMGILVTSNTGGSWTLVSQTSDSTPLVFAGKSISAIAFNTRPGSSSNVVAGVENPGLAPGNDDGIVGAVYSSDAGAHWYTSSILDGSTQLTQSSVTAVVYNPVENKFFLVSKYHGVFVSADQGHTFTKLSTQPNPSVLSETNCPAATNTSTCELYRGTMAVRYVTPGTESTATDEMYIWMVGFDSAGDTIDLNLYQTKNGGSTWAQINEAGINAQSGGDAYGVDQAWYDIYLGAVPNGSGTDLYAGAINIYKCSVTSANPTCAVNPFLNLTHVYDNNCYGTAGFPDVHPDEHGFDYSGSNPKIVFFGNDGGMYRTLDETTLVTGDCSALNVFDNMNADLGSLSQFVWGSQKYNNNTELMGGTQDNGTMYVDGSLGLPGNAGWIEQNGGDGGYNAIDPSDNWFSTFTNATVQVCPGGWVHCTAWEALAYEGEYYDYGTNSYVNYDGVDGDSSAFYTPFILDPQDPTKVIVGTCRIWRGGNTNATWPNTSLQNALSHKFNSTLDTSCGNDATDNDIASIAAGGPKTSSGSQVIYAGTSYGETFGGGVYVTKTAGAPGTAPTAWTDVTGSINPNGYQVNGIAVDPHDATGGTAIAVIQGFTGGPGKVWRTTNFGSAWTDISGNLPDVPANDVLVDPDNSTVIYVATDIGVFVTSDEATWVEVGPNTIGATGFLPNTTVFHIAMYENGSDKRLRAWTHGRGAWETVLASPPTGVTYTPTSLTFTSTVGVASAVQGVTVTNNDAVAVTLSLITFTYTGTTAPAYETGSISNICTGGLPAGASCQFGVQFTPPSAGSFPATMTVTTSDATTPTLTVTLTGTGTPPTATDFSFDSTSTTTATVTAGSPASYSLVIDSTPTGATFNPAITFACSGLPAKTACTFNPTSITQPGSVALSISTTANSSAEKGRITASNSHFGGLLAASMAIPGLAFLIPGFASRSRRKRMLMYLGMMMIVAGFISMAACGGGSSNNNGGGGGGNTGTPTGTYTVGVTGTYGTTTHMQNVTLTVQ